MIKVKNLTKYILGETLFKDVNFVLDKNDKIGFIGPNGCGKSTLFKIIMGETDYDSGEIKIENEKIGYLPQDLIFGSQITISEFLNIKDSAKINKILKEAKLTNIPYDFKISKLSGGQKTRLAVLKILASKPTFLLFDEPTNHLDTDGLEWLEKIINDFTGGVLVISHDRKLLDNCVNKILELNSINYIIEEYEGGYTEYIFKKENKMQKWENDYKLQQKEKRRMELWLALKKQEASLRPDPAKGRKIRAMEKRLQREIYDNEIPKPKINKKIRNLELKGENPDPKLILKVRNVNKNFVLKNVLVDINFEIRGKEHVLLFGKNGSGKSTLLKIIANILNPDSGEIKIGENINIGYFSQEHETLNLEKSVLEEFVDTEKILIPKDPRAILGSFLFKGNDVFKKISDLSLGERVRLIFAKLTNQENQVLLLDEPTNHLDIQSREVIEKALIDYKGAIIVVSHDRYFLDKIGINKKLILENGCLKEEFV